MRKGTTNILTTKPRRVRVEHKDVIEELDEILDWKYRPGTADSDINVFSIEYPVPYYLLLRLREEIVRLRGQK
jgi:hypothetical protein